jgi:manganese oxidase
MPPTPTAAFQGYPFYIAGQAGHRPPQPPLDLVVENGEHLDGGLPRHRILDGAALDGESGVDEIYMKDLTNEDDLYYKGRKTVNENAKRVRSSSGLPELFGFARKLESARIELLPLDGTASEKSAMAFHEAPGRPIVTTKYGWQARSYDSFDSSGLPKAFLVNGKAAKPGAPYADPCPIGQPMRKYKAAYIQFDMTVNKAGWHDPQARIAVLQEDVKSTLDSSANGRPPEPLFIRANSDECIVFEATNLVPSALNVDDFQLFSPTDIIGQHIHLVKFDVTSSDGSENGWNYEDGTYSPDEVRERIDANNTYQASFGGTQILKPKAQAFFTSDKFTQAKCGLRDPQGKLLAGQEDGPWCGAQTTAQRWWADPVLNSTGEDRTLRTVFTHDHFGPSSHQHHGLYAALVIEPRNSEWQKPDGTAFGGTHLGSQLISRSDGGPTSYAANIVLPAPHEDQSRREFNLAFADFAIVYDENNKPVSGPEKMESDLPVVVLHPTQPRPESISAGDPGTQLLNYRNEPIPLRIAKNVNGQPKQKDISDQYPACQLLAPENCIGDANACILKACDPGNMANVFSSKTHIGQSSVPNFKFSNEAANTREPGDPATPLLTAYQGDKVQLRLVQGAQEENHVFTMNGMKWLTQPGSPNSGYVNAQHVGISEHFEFEVKTIPQRRTSDHLYSASATDNLWDGTWGLLRAYPTNDDSHPQLARLPNNPKSLVSGSKDQCPQGVPQREFDVTAWRVSDFLKKKADGSANELYYNTRFGISDPNAIIFLKDRESLRVKKKDPQTGTVTDQVIYDTPVDQTTLRNGTRGLEPLILRVAAGDCVTVTLHNNLDNGDGNASLTPAQRQSFIMKDGPSDSANENRTWSWNMVPPIVDHFNFNQVRSSNRVGLHSKLLASFPELDDGANVGLNRDTTAAPGQTQGYTWYAGEYKMTFNAAANKWQPSSFPIEFGASSLSDSADVIKHTAHGAIGALIVEPEDSFWSLDAASNASADVCRGPWQAKCNRTLNNKANPDFLFREFTLLYQDDLALYQSSIAMANLRNGDDAEDSGQKGFNYRSEPIWARLGAGGPATGPEAMMQYDFSKAFSSKLDARGNCEFDGSSIKPCDPETPLFTAVAGTAIRLRVIHPGGHPRNHAFTLFGHNWQTFPWTNNSTVIGNNPNSDLVGSANGIGPGRTENIVAKAGGQFAVPGDYMYRTQEGFTFGGGLWGILRVTCDTSDIECAKKAGNSK